MDTPAPPRGRIVGFESTDYNAVSAEGRTSAGRAPVVQPTARNVIPAAVNQNFAVGGGESGVSPILPMSDSEGTPRAMGGAGAVSKLSAQQQAQAQARSNLAVTMQSATQSTPHVGENNAEFTPKKKSRNARRNAARRLKKKTMSAAAAAVVREHHAPAMDLVAVQTATPPLPLAAAQPSVLSQMAYKMLRPAAAPRVVYETPAPAGVGKRDNSTEPPFALI
jgi:hypothetical protein